MLESVESERFPVKTGTVKTGTDKTGTDKNGNDKTGKTLIRPDTGGRGV